MCAEVPFHCRGAYTNARGCTLDDYFQRGKGHEGVLMTEFGNLRYKQASANSACARASPWESLPPPLELLQGSQQSKFKLLSSLISLSR